jgi:hypothetical protein
MRLFVNNQRSQFDQQTCAYAEYRAFSSLVGTMEPVADVRITLTRRPAYGACQDGRIVCSIAVTMASGRATRAQAVSHHAYSAIDAAVSLVRTTVPTTGRAGDGGDDEWPHEDARTF